MLYRLIINGPKKLVKFVTCVKWSLTSTICIPACEFGYGRSRKASWFIRRTWSLLTGRSNTFRPKSNPCGNDNFFFYVPGCKDLSVVDWNRCDARRASRAPHNCNPYVPLRFKHGIVNYQLGCQRWFRFPFCSFNNKYILQKRPSDNIRISNDLEIV